MHTCTTAYFCSMQAGKLLVVLQSAGTRKDTTIKTLNSKVDVIQRDLINTQKRFNEEKALLTKREAELLTAKAEASLNSIFPVLRLQAANYPQHFSLMLAVSVDAAHLAFALRSTWPYIGLTAIYLGSSFLTH